MNVIDISIVQLHMFVDIQENSEAISLVVAYFKKRIFENLPLQDFEKFSLVELISYFKDSTRFSKGSSNKVLSLIGKFLVYSFDSPRYELFTNLRANQENLKEDDFLLYLDILIRNAAYCVDFSSIQENCFRYLKYTEHPQALFQLFEKYDYCFETQSLNSFLEELKRYSSNVQKKRLANDNMKQAIMYGDKKITNEFKNTSFFDYQFPVSFSPLVVDERIITIDPLNSPDLDGAFSIVKDGDYYHFHVYITNVPDFLKLNPSLALEAYERCFSFYIHNNLKTYQFDMLPSILSHHYLSLKNNYFKEVIAFNFIILKGEILSCSLEKRSIKVTEQLTNDEVEKILSSTNDCTSVRNDLMNLQSMAREIIKKTKKPYLKDLNAGVLSDLISLPSILVNYYIGEHSEFAIYREHSFYSKDTDSFYTHSVTPLRNFVSDINLAFFLEQQGISSYSFDDFRYVQNNIDAILNHINERDEVRKFLQRHKRFARSLVLEK